MQSHLPPEVKNLPWKYQKLDLSAGPLVREPATIHLRYKNEMTKSEANK
jgi:hypothetical protein